MDINTVLKIGFSQYQKGQLNDDCLQAYFAGAMNAFLTIGADKQTLVNALKQYGDIPTVANLIKPKQSQSNDTRLVYEDDFKSLVNHRVYESLSAAGKPWDKAIVKTSNGLESVKEVAVFKVNDKERAVIITVSGGK